MAALRPIVCAICSNCGQLTSEKVCRICLERVGQAFYSVLAARTVLTVTATEEIVGPRNVSLTFKAETYTILDELRN